MTNEPSNCAFCGAPVSPNARFCEACGQPVSAAAQSPFESAPASAESWSQPEADEFPIPPMPQTDRWGSTPASASDNDPQRWGSPQTLTPPPAVSTPHPPKYQAPVPPSQEKKFPWKGIIIAAVILIALSCLCVLGLGIVLINQTGTMY